MNRKRVSIVTTNVVREKSVLYQNQDGKRNITNAEDVVNMTTSSFLLNSGKEKVYVICLDTQNVPVAISEVYTGTVSAALVDPADIVKLAILTNSSNVIMVHTHPSGNPVPSDEDNNLTERVKAACKLFDLNLLDHVIIGANGNGSYDYYSFNEEVKSW